jgi:predicted N-acetyltransferase YhbS
MIQIDLLKNHPDAIPKLANIWHEVIGKIWAPDVTFAQVTEKLKSHLSDEKLPIAYVALDNGVVVGMCALRVTDGIRPELTPWLGGLCVSPNHQNKGIGKILISRVLSKAKELGYDRIYLLAFDPTIPSWYASLGWQHIGTDTLLGKEVAVMALSLM